MNKIFIPLFILFAFGLSVQAQSPAVAVPEAQDFGKIDQADLELKECPFEKDANAEVLFDKGDASFEGDAIYNVRMVEQRHSRIKIFKDEGKGLGNVSITYLGGTNLEHITDIEAETFNLVDGKIQITRLDKSQIFKEVIDKQTSKIVFSMPDVRPGSIIEYRYTYTSVFRFPFWYFQNMVPVRYSEFNALIPSIITFNEEINIQQPLLKHTRANGSIKIGTQNIDAQIEQFAMENVPSLPNEPEMTSFLDNLESVKFVSFGELSNRWSKIGKTLNDDDDFGSQLNKKLTAEDSIINKAKLLTTDDDKIDYVFDAVKNKMKWDGINNSFTNIGVSKAWENSSGNSAEINIALYHLLKKSGIKACPMLVSTRKNGKVNPGYAFLGQFNSTVVFVPLNADSTDFYVLDATDKYNTYDQIPEDLLNSSGLCVDNGNRKFNIVSLEDSLPVRKVVLINGDISADGSIKGNAEISDYGYNRTKSLESYHTNGVEKYTEYLTNNDNNLKISDLKFQNADIDSLPFTQDFNFKLTLSQDDNYIYFNPNLFTSLYKNPFLSESRVTDIDFGYRDNYSVSGIYTIPAGYKVDVLPKSITIVMPDNSISFKRVVIEQDGSVMVRYIIDHKQTIYFKENYADFFGFYKKMYELLNEQIVLKKS